MKLSAEAQATYRRIIAVSEERLARWSLTNPMRPTLERHIAEARKALGE